MDRTLRIPLQEVLPGHSRQRRQAGGLRKLGCLVGLCLVFQVFLTFPVLYLLKDHFRKAALGPEPAMGRYSALTAKSRAMIHLIAEKPEFTASSNYLPILHWKVLNTERFQYSDGVLEILEEGDYFIYSRVTFESRLEEVCDLAQTDHSHLPLTHLAQYISKGQKSYGYGKPVEKLLSGSTTISAKSVGPKCKPWRKAIYLGAVFHLQKSDRLMVNVSHIDLVKVMETFFGLAALN